MSTDTLATKLVSRVSSSSELTVVSIVEALEIDLVQIHPGADVVEHLAGAVAVGHIAREQPPCPGALENLDRPLARYQRLVVA
jgi:hypothetical protein